MNEENSLWMGDISPWMNEDIILAFFKSYNFYPLSVKLIKDKITNHSKNYCFISFKTNLEANTALKQLNGKPILNTNNIFKLNWASYHSPINRTIYVGNLHKEINEEMLLTFFRAFYKSANKANIIRDNGISKGYGFVAFKNEKEYKKSLEEMNGKIINGISIIVREHKKKDEKNNKNENNKELFSNKINDIKKNSNIISNKYENENMYINNINSNMINNINRNNNILNQLSHLKNLNNNNFNNNTININYINSPQINNNNFNINNKKFINNKINFNYANENAKNILPNSFVMEGNNIKTRLNNNKINLENNLMNYNVKDKSNNEFNQLKNSLNKNINNNNNKIEKKNKNKKCYQLKKLEILEIIDEETLIKKIINSINRAFNNYKICCENNGNKVKSKYIFN